MMREESHLDDMRAAIRGDFERLEQRRGAQELMRAAAPEEPPAEQIEELARDAPDAEQRSWLERLLGR